MEMLKAYSAQFNQYFNSQIIAGNPNSLYEPIDYILKLGGKRIRPLLVMIGNDVFNGEAQNALPVAYAIELFHNFSLIHDDIMDKAPLRRGQPTVHQKYNMPTAILSGDAALVMAYEYILKTNTTHHIPLLHLFNTTALQVCEGQQMDMDFETNTYTTIAAYLEMIALKTSVLLGASFQMGAILANANLTQQNLMYHFGKNLGIAFQLQDDYLDSFGSAAAIGKQIGGDIISNKKTFLWLRLLDQLSAADTILFNKALTASNVEKVSTIQQLFIKYACDVELTSKVNDYSNLAKQCVEGLEISADHKTMLINLVDGLVVRTS